MGVSEARSRKKNLCQSPWLARLGRVAQPVPVTARLVYRLQVLCLGNYNSNPFCIDQIDLQSKTTNFATQVWAITLIMSLITVDPPDFL